MQDGGFDIMMQFSRDVTSSSHVTYTKRKIFGHTIYPIMFHCDCFYSGKYMKPPPTQRR